MPLETLAGLLVGSVLVPMATKGIEKIGEEIGARMGKAGADKTTSILGKIRDKVRSLFTSEEDRDTLKAFERFPENMKTPLERELANKLAKDPQAAKELQALLDQRLPEGKGLSIGSIVADTVGVVNAQGSHISGGIVAGVVVNPQPSSPGGQKSNPKGNPAE